MIVDLAVELGQLLLQRLDAAGRCSSSGACRSARRSRWRSATIISTIWRRRATRSARSRVVSSGNGAAPRLGGLDKMGDDGGVDRIGLGPLAQRLGKGAHLRRIDHHDRQARRPPGRPQRPSQNRRWPRPRSMRGAERPAAATPTPPYPRHCASTTKLRRVGRTHTSNRSLADIDANNDGVHLIPSLRKRARCAAQATVRVRWNGRRRPTLSHGLGVPQGDRSHARHRTGSF